VRSGRVKKSTFVKRVERVIQGEAEHKFGDYHQGVVTIVPATTQVKAFTQYPAVGAPYNGRIGDKIRVVSLKSRIWLTAGDAYNRVRLTIFAWSQGSSGATPPTAADVYEDASSSPNALVSYFNTDRLRAKNVKIMWDKTFAFNPPNGTNQMVKLQNVFFKMNRNMAFDSATGAVRTYTYWILATSDSALAPSPTFDFYTRMTWTDV